MDTILLKLSALVDFLIDIETYLRGVKRYIRDRYFKKLKLPVDPYFILPRFFYNISSFPITVVPSDLPEHLKILKSHKLKHQELSVVKPFEAVLLRNMYVQLLPPSGEAGISMSECGEFQFLSKDEIEMVRNGVDIKTCEGLRDCRERHKAARQLFYSKA